MDAFTTTTSLDLAAAETAVRDALADHGFGVLTEIDIAATLKAKLDIDRPPLKILGACNPQLAHKALTVDPAAALVLPCNVVLETTDAGTKISAADPHNIITNPALTELADEAAGGLSAAIATIPPDNNQR